jgi:secondary thiamine-phosphate synthase enzyme
MIVTKTIQVQTMGNTDIIDITPPVETILTESGLNEGTVTVFVTHSTAGIAVMEFEPGLIADFKAYWDRTVPRNMSYKHDAGLGEGNGHAHVRASVLGPSVTIPFADHRLATGTWQQIALVDFDIRRRTRQIVVQVMGETA